MIPRTASDFALLEEVDDDASEDDNDGGGDDDDDAEEARDDRLMLEWFMPTPSIVLRWLRPRKPSTRTAATNNITALTNCPKGIMQLGYGAFD